jgi:hypothetical protein
MPNSLSAPRFLSAELFVRHNPLIYRRLRPDHRAKKRLRRGWSGCRARGQNATRGDEFSQRARHRLLPRKRLRGVPPARTSFEVVRHHVATRRGSPATRRAAPATPPQASSHCSSRHPRRHQMVQARHHETTPLFPGSAMRSLARHGPGLTRSPRRHLGAFVPWWFPQALRLRFR